MGHTSFRSRDARDTRNERHRVTAVHPRSDKYDADAPDASWAAVDRHHAAMSTQSQVWSRRSRSTMSGSIPNSRMMSSGARLPTTPAPTGSRA